MADFGLAEVLRARGQGAAAEDRHHAVLAGRLRCGLRPAVAESVEALAELAAGNESWAEAARLHAAAGALREDMGLVHPPARHEHLAAALAYLRAAAGDAAFDAAWVEGSKLTLDEVVAYATRARGERKRPTIEQAFTFRFRSGAALEPNCAVADVRRGSAEIWGSFKSPILCQEQAAALLGLAPTAVTVHVVDGGGSFGRHCFSDAALEAVEASRAFGRPVRLMWHRSDDIRHGRVHPMSISRVRATVLDGGVISFEHRHTGVVTDFRHGFGEIFTAAGAGPSPGKASSRSGSTSPTPTGGSRRR